MKIDVIRVTARWQFEGFHRWPSAPDNRAYLREKHRHLFHCEATIAVSHDDRQIEFHDLRDACVAVYPDGIDVGPQSCENIAVWIVSALSDKWPDREVRVRVFEDGENGAEVVGTT